MKDSSLRKSLRIAAVTGSAAAVALAGALWLQPKPALDADAAVAQQLNQFTKSHQGQAALDVNSEGEWLTVWTSRRQQEGHYAVLARAYAADGSVRSGEVPINQFAGGVQEQPSVAWVDSNTAWVAWQSTDADNSGMSVLARRIGSSAAPLGDEVLVNEATEGDQSQPVVAANAHGVALVAWSHHDEARGRTELRSRSWQQGQWGSEQIVASAEASRDTVPTATALDDGRFLVAWARKGSDSPQPGVLARFVDSQGLPLGTEFLVSQAATGQIEPSVTATQSGFEVAWLSLDGSAYDVVKRSFDGSGRPLGSTEVVAHGDDAWKNGVSIAALPDEQLLVSFNSVQADGSSDVLGQLYDRWGQPSHAEPISLIRGEGSQELTPASGARRTASGHNGILAVAWNGNGPNDNAGAHWSLFGSQAVPTPVKTVTTSDLELLGARPPFRTPNHVQHERDLTMRGAGGDFGFFGIANTGLTPPDPEIAVGPQGIVLVANDDISGYLLEGTRRWQDTQLNFWGDLGASGLVFDPEVAWDPHNERFWVMAAEQASDNRDYFLLAVSNDSNPLNENDWQKFRIDVTDLAGAGGFADFIDSPNLALNQDFVLLTADFFSPDNEYLIVVLEKEPLLDGNLGQTAFELFQGTSGSSPHSMGIPVVYSSDTSNLYILQSTEFGSNDEVIVHAISDPFTNYTRQTATVAVSQYSFPSPPPQRDTGIRPTLFEPRFWSVAERNGSIWAVHHVNSDRARVRWYQIDLGNWPNSGSPTLAQEGEIDLGGDIHTFFPSIHVDAADNAAISFARSAPNEYISFGRALRAASDPPNTFRPTQVVQTSQNESTAGRWGDYSGTQADPTTVGAFWGHHEFTASSPSDWDTWVANYVLRDQPFELEVDPLVAGSSATLRVTGADGFATIAFVASAEGTGLTEIPAFNVTFSVEGARLLGTAVASPAGNAEITISLPGGASGTEVTLQAAQMGLSTNWVVDTVQ